MTLRRSNNNVVRRVAAWDAADNNTSIFGVHYGSYNLFEDVAGWGTARKIFSMSQGGDYTTIRRAWGRWERSTVGRPEDDLLARLQQLPLHLRELPGNLERPGHAADATS